MTPQFLVLAFVAGLWTGLALSGRLGLLLRLCRRVEQAAAPRADFTPVVPIVACQKCGRYYQAQPSLN